MESMPVSACHECDPLIATGVTRKGTRFWLVKPNPLRLSIRLTMKDMPSYQKEKKMTGNAKNWQHCYRLVAFLLMLPLIFTIGCAGLGKTTNQVADEWSATAKQQVTTTTRLNMAPFAQHLVTLVGDIQFGLSGVQPVYTRQYLKGPETAEFIESMAQFKRNLARIIAYSGRVVSLARSNLPGPKRAQALADFVDVVRPLERGDSEIKFKYTEEDTVKILDQVRQQENLLAALQVAQPLVVEAAVFLRNRVDEMKTNRLKAEAEIEKQIEADYIDVLTYHETLKRRQRHNFKMISLMVKALEEEDRSALEEVAAQDKQLGRIVMKDTDSQVTADDKAVLLVTKRLELIDKHKRFIAGDIDQFRKVLQELEALTDASDKALQKAKIAVILWSKAHARLAAGETDPAKYDFMSIAKFAFDLIL